MVRPGDDWVAWARWERLPDVRRRVRERVETVRQGEVADVPFTGYVTARTSANLARCREIASRKAGVMLTNGQLLALFSTGYLLEHDVATSPPAQHPSPVIGRPGGVGTGKRQLPATDERPNERTVPAQVIRALEERSGGLCEFGACDRPAQEVCHLVPHADGSGREVEDLVHGCHRHHIAYDGGLIRFMGWTRADDPLGADLPVFRVVETREVLQPKPRPTGGPAVEDASPWLLRALGRRLRLRLERRGGP